MIFRKLYIGFILYFSKHDRHIVTSDENIVMTYLIFIWTSIQIPDNISTSYAYAIQGVIISIH